MRIYNSLIMCGAYMERGEFSIFSYAYLSYNVSTIIIL